MEINLFEIKDNVYTNLIIPSKFIDNYGLFIDINYIGKVRYNLSIDDIVTIKKYGGELYSNPSLKRKDVDKIFEVDEEKRFVNLIVPKEFIKKINSSPDINFIGRNINTLSKGEQFLIKTYKEFLDVQKMI